jgi:hypothetical protein
MVAGENVAQISCWRGHQHWKNKMNRIIVGGDANNRVSKVGVLANFTKNKINQKNYIKWMLFF